MRRRCALFAALMLVLSAGSARAVVIDWTLGKLSVYLQSASNLAPSAPLLHEVYAQFASNDTDEFLAVALDGASGGAVPLDAQPGGKRWDISLGFATAAQLEAAIPAGDYTLAAATATSTIRETVSLRPGSLDSIPYFTGSVFEILSGLNPAEPLRLEWNAPGVDVNQVTLHVDSLSGGQPPVAVDATGETRLTLAPGTLAPNTVYSLSIEFASEQPDQRDGFSAGDGRSVVKNLTEITFTTGDVPEPSGLLLVAALGTWVASRRRAR